MGTRPQRAVRIPDLGDAEALALLPQHLVRDRFAVQADRGELGRLPYARIVRVGDVPVLEDAVPAGGELTGDRLNGVERAVVADGELGVEVSEHHRIAGG